MTSAQNHLPYVNLNVILLKDLCCSIKLGSHNEIMEVNLSLFSWDNFPIHVKSNGNMGKKWYQNLYGK